MIKLMKRWYRYVVAKMTGSFNENADPKVQLEQAIMEAQEQHKQLKQQAANVIANQKQTEAKLSRVLEDLEKVSGNARQAVMMAEQATQAGDATKAAEYTNAAETFANRMISLESEAEDLKSLHQQASQAANQAKSAVEKNSMVLQKKLSEKNKLLGQLDQAKMQEQMNSAMAQLSEVVGDEIPSFEEVRSKVEARYARAQGAAELEGASVEGRMLEVEQAAMNVEAQNRLAQIRAQLGIGAEEQAAPAEEPGTAQAQPSEGT